MADFLEKVEKMKALPWKVIGAIVFTGFVLATAASTILGYLLAPNLVAGRTPRPAANDRVDLTFGGGSATLTSQQIEAILKRNLFNSKGELGDQEPTQNEEANSTGQADLPKSSLPVNLIGTIYGGSPFNGIALIENTAQKSINSFLVGDTLLKEAVVREVHRERVILERNGRREFIALAEYEIKRTNRTKKGRPVPAAPAATDFGGEVPLANEPPPENFREEGFSREGQKIEMSMDYKQKVLGTDLPKVLQDAKATPNLVDGEIRGFVLTRIRKDSIYEKAGFQNGDIIEEINGSPLSDPGQAIKLLNSLRNENEIEVRLKSQGRTVNKVLTIR